MSGIVAIRADGNSEIGFGHLMRMQALARHLEKRGAKVIFLSRNPENLTGCSVEVIRINDGVAVEDREVEDMIESCQADMLIIDSYVYKQEHLDRIAGLDLVSVYIDDMNRHPFNTNYVVNGNLYAPQLDYRGRAESLLGSEYLLMREEFCGLRPRNLSKQVKNVLISLGAADMENITPWMLKTLFSYDKFSRLNWQVVIGPVFRNIEEIEFIAQGRTNVFLHHSPDIKKLMEKCDISINAAGSTTYELAACGVPALLLVVADNQLELAREADLRGFAINLGWCKNLPPRVLFRELDGLIDDLNTRQEMVQRGQVLIDGAGAGRVAEILLEAVRRKRHARNNTG